jgi:HSP20 family protein
MNKLVKWDPFNALFSWDPFRELEEMHNRLTSFFGRRLPLLRGPAEAEEMTLSTWTPLVDIAEDDKEYVINVELPGMKKEEVKVSVEDRVLSISGERKSEKEEKGKKYHRSEQTYGAFMRSFALPESASGEKLSADYQDGILKVHIPKAESAKTREIEVIVS